MHCPGIQCEWFFFMTIKLYGLFRCQVGFLLRFSLSTTFPHLLHFNLNSFSHRIPSHVGIIHCAQWPWRPPPASASSTDSSGRTSRWSAACRPSGGSHGALELYGFFCPTLSIACRCLRPTRVILIVLYFTPYPLGSWCSHCLHSFRLLP